MAEQAAANPAAESAAPATAAEGAPQTHESLGADAGSPPPPPPRWSTFLASPWFLILIGVWLWVFWSARKQKQKEQKRKDELNDIKKGDRVVTIGRLHGTIVSLTEETMTIKPDEKGSTTLTFDRVALLKKVVPGEKGGGASET